MTIQTRWGVALHEANPYLEDGRELTGNLVWDGGLALAGFFVAGCEARRVGGARRPALAWLLLLGTAVLPPLAALLLARVPGPEPASPKRMLMCAAFLPGAVFVIGAPWVLWSLARRRDAIPAASVPLRGARVLELGAGVGAVGLTLASLGAEVLVTDREPEILALLRQNISANDLGARASARALDFEDASTYVSQTRWDVVVASEALYEGPHGDGLAHALVAHMRPGAGTEAFVAYCHREEAPLGTFCAALCSEGLRLERLEDSRGLAVAGSHGSPEKIYAGSRFQALPLDGVGVATSLRTARGAQGNSWGPSDSCVQILRITRSGLTQP